MEVKSLKKTKAKRKRLYLLLAKDKFSNNWIGADHLNFPCSGELRKRVVKRKYESLVKEFKAQYGLNCIMSNECFNIITLAVPKKKKKGLKNANTKASK